MFESRAFVDLIDKMGDDFRPAMAARVSFNSVEYKDRGRNQRLMNYLSRERHFTPFNHIMLSMRFEAPISVARQLMRHGYLVISEVSLRYVKGGERFFMPTWREAPQDGVKQGSGPEIEDEELIKKLDEVYKKAVETAKEAYDTLLDMGVAQEQARFVLPCSLYVKWIFTGSMYAFYRLYEERISPGAQKETREYAREVDRIIRDHYPEAWGALTSWKTVRLKAEEG